MLIFLLFSDQISRGESLGGGLLGGSSLPPPGKNPDPCIFKHGGTYTVLDCTLSTLLRVFCVSCAVCYFDYCTFTNNTPGTILSLY